MNFSCTQQDLISAVSTVLKSTSKKPSPFQQYIYIEATQYNVRLVCYTSDNTLICTLPAQIHEPGTVLVTYAETVFTAEGNTLYRLTVEATEDESKHKMTVYTDSQTSEYLIPVFPYESCYNYVMHEQLWQWNDLEEYECLTGKLISLTILLDGAPVTVSTDQMPQDGESILSYLHSHFADYIKEEYKQ